MVPTIPRPCCDAKSTTSPISPPPLEALAGVYMELAVPAGVPRAGGRYDGSSHELKRNHRIQVMMTPEQITTIRAEGEWATVSRKRKNVKNTIKHHQRTRDTTAKRRGCHEKGFNAVPTKEKLGVGETKRWIQRVKAIVAPRKVEPGERFGSWCLSGNPNGCDRHARNVKAAIDAVIFLSLETKVMPIKRLRLLVDCGTIKQEVRKVFAPELPTWVELSIRTSQKLERPCKSCNENFKRMRSEWKNKRNAPVEVNRSHLERFRRAFAMNVDEGWNKGSRPYIPNGHGTRTYKRSEGGSWNEEEFSDECRIEVVFSSGKPRIVTLYSGFNNEVLTPLHKALYGRIKRKGWLLVGPPTEKNINALGGDDYISADYSSATDNIKIMYVKECVSVLIEKGQGLSDDEIRCLKVVSSLTFDGTCAASGQPMGSLMSFPLLCLINKSLNDLALQDMVVEKKIRRKDAVGHRCLINGDDLVTREIGDGTLMERIAYHGNEVGMTLNKQKTMKSPTEAEINSTLFVSTAGTMRLKRKANCAALDMRPEVNDVIGYARDSTVRGADGLRRLVRRNAHILSKQPRKLFKALNTEELVALRSDKKCKEAFCALPRTERPEPANYFPTEKISPGSTLMALKVDIVDLIGQRVKKIRGAIEEVMSDVKQSRRRWRTDTTRGAQGWRRSIRVECSKQDERTLEIIAHEYKEINKGKLFAPEITKLNQRIDANPGVPRGLTYIQEIRRCKLEGTLPKRSVGVVPLRSKLLFS